MLLILVDIITSQNNTVQDLKHNQLDVIFFHKNRNIRPQKIYDLFLKHTCISKCIAASNFLFVVFLIFSHYVIYGFPLWNQCKQMLRWLRINASHCQWKHDSYMTLAEKLKLLWYMLLPSSRNNGQLYCLGNLWWLLWKVGLFIFYFPLISAMFTRH